MNWGHTLLAMSHSHVLDLDQKRALLTEAQTRYRDATTANPEDDKAFKCLGDAFFMLAELEVSPESRHIFLDSAGKQYKMALQINSTLRIPFYDRLDAEFKA